MDDRPPTAEGASTALLLRRRRFATLWTGLPSLTVLVSEPGWGRSTWMRQCAEHLDRTGRATTIVEVDDLAALEDRLGTPPAAPDDEAGLTLVLVDGLEQELAVRPDRWGELLRYATSDARVRVVVAAADDPPSAVRETAPTLVLDEHDLAFDDEELAEIRDLLIASVPHLDLHAVPAAMRGCPTLVGRYAAQVLADARSQVWGVPDLSARASDRLRRTAEPAAPSAIAALVEQLEGWRTFTPEIAAQLRPGDDTQRLVDRLRAWPELEPAIDPETDAEGLAWTPQAWEELARRRSPAHRRDSFALARGAAGASAGVVTRIVVLLAADGVREAERLTVEHFRRVLMFATPALVEALTRQPPDPARTPALALVDVEMRVRRLGHDPAARPVALAAAAVLRRSAATDVPGELTRTCLTAFAFVSAGRHEEALRLLHHAHELTATLSALLVHEEVGERARLGGYVYLAYWSAIQLDRHDTALALAHALATTFCDPRDRLAELDAVCLSTQLDLAGRQTLEGEHLDGEGRAVPSHAISLRALDTGRDDEAIAPLRTLIARPGPMPSRSAIDGMTLLVRAVAAPDGLTARDVHAVVRRSTDLWEGRASSFVVLGGMLALATLGLGEDAVRLLPRLPSDDRDLPDELAPLARVVGAQLADDHVRAARDADLAWPLLTTPRLRVIAGVLGAASLVRLGRTEAAAHTLVRTWRAVPAAGLLRTALRLVPAVEADRLVELGGTDPALEHALREAAGDARGLRWERPVALSRAELDVVALLDRGMTNTEIAAARHVTTGTLRNQLKSIHRKLGTQDRAGLLRAVQQRDLLAGREGSRPARG